MQSVAKKIAMIPTLLPNGEIMKPKIKRIHVNRHIIASNKKNGTIDPVLTVKIGSEKVIRTSEVFFMGKNRLVYSPLKPLSCGATVWIETKDKIIVNGRIFE